MLPVQTHHAICEIYRCLINSFPAQSAVVCDPVPYQQVTSAIQRCLTVFTRKSSAKYLLLHPLLTDIESISVLDRRLVQECSTSILTHLTLSDAAFFQSILHFGKWLHLFWLLSLMLPSAGFSDWKLNCP